MGFVRIRSCVLFLVAGIGIINRYDSVLFTADKAEIKNWGFLFLQMNLYMFLYVYNISRKSRSLFVSVRVLLFLVTETRFMNRLDSVWI